jgi:tRNA(Ile)-lysidine synthase
MPLLNQFINYIQEQYLFQKNDGLLLAVSGGLDSVVLCELCHQAGFNFEIAHCNFQLRGEESEGDEKFVRALGEKYQVKVSVKKFDTRAYAEKNKISIQVAARELRYAWFDELIEADDRRPATENLKPASYIKHQTSYILTAHHANDNIETLLMNFFKGTGITGLRSIVPKKDRLIRPLLFAKRAEIAAFAEEHHLDFVEDSSNISDKYTRNYFRNQLIPSVQKVFPQAEENLLKNIDRFSEIEMLYQQSIHLHKMKLLEPKGNEIHIPVLKLQQAKPLKTIVYEIIKDFGFTAHQTDEVVGLLKSESGKYVSSASHKVIKNRNWLIISPINTMEANNVLIEQTDKEIDFEGGKLKIKRRQNADNHLPNASNIASLDAANITFPLLLRKWKQGDYFYPLGMQKKKKLSKFFIDQKMSLPDKEKIWVIESNRKIVWIIGKRIDDRFKITPTTKEILEISLD